jgi:hypothetical protein
MNASSVSERATGAAPWQPRVGDRVRVRAGLGEQTRCDGLPHYVDEEGRIGTVAGVHPLVTFPLHRYLVRLDKPYPVVYLGLVPIKLSVRQYAADELEPID